MEEPRAAHPSAGPLAAPAPSAARNDFFARLWRQSCTSLRLDLRRPTPAEPVTRRGLFRPAAKTSRTLTVNGTDIGDATLSVLQNWELGAPLRVAHGKRPRRAFDLAGGLVFDTSLLELQPVLRAKVRIPGTPIDFVLRALPVAEALLKVTLPLPGTGLMVAARLSLPWTEEAFDAITTGRPLPFTPILTARLLTSSAGGRLRFSSRGVELAEQSIQLGAETILRAAATVDFPRQWPITEEDTVRLHLDKVAFKTRIRYGNSYAFDVPVAVPAPKKAAPTAAVAAPHA